MERRREEKRGGSERRSKESRGGGEEEGGERKEGRYHGLKPHTQVTYVTLSPPRCDPLTSNSFI